jgi:putative Ig domain-containing protein
MPDSDEAMRRFSGVTRLRRRDRSADEGGFVLLESIVAIGIVTVIMTGLIAMLTSTIKTTTHFRIKQQAIQLADTAIEKVRSYDPNSLVDSRDTTSVLAQYGAGRADAIPTPPPALSTALQTMLPISDSPQPAGTGTVSAICPAPTTALAPYLPTTPVCQLVGTQRFWVSYYLGKCFVADAVSICTVPQPAGNSVVYLRAVVAVTWTDPASSAPCVNSSCMYVTSTLINASLDPLFDIDHAGPGALKINWTDQTNNVGDSGTRSSPFPSPTLQTNTVAPYTWSATGLPPGLKMAPADGRITGTIADRPGLPPVLYPVTVTVVDGLIQRDISATFIWSVYRPTIVTPSPAPTPISTPVSLQVVATCLKTPCTYTMTNGPTGLTIDAGTGLITGTPTVVGTVTVTVSITDGNGISATSDPFDWIIVPQPASVCVSEIALTNGSFENPAVLSGAPNWMVGGAAPLQWDTTEPDNVIELWKNDGTTGALNAGNTAQAANGGQPISAEDGTQWAELNANQTGALYQNLQTDPGVVLQWSVWHRGRYSSGIGSKKDIMRVQIGSTTSQQDQPATRVDPATNLDIGAPATDIADDYTAWHLYRGFYIVPPGQTTTRFQFAAISTASGNDSIGNFIDDLSLNNKVACVGKLPDPQTSTVNTAIVPLQLSAIRGSGNYTWGGGATLPAGLSITTGGLITGTPTTVGVRSVQLTLTDTQTAYRTVVPFTWTIVATPLITAPSNQTTSVGGDVNLKVVSTCLNKPCSYTMTNGPSGLTVNSLGVITGTVTGSAQVFNNAKITVVDADGATATTAAFTWTVLGGPVITSPGDQKTLRGASVSLAMAPHASGGISPYSYSSSGLPSWLSIDSATGVISGVAPSSADSVTTGITVILTDSLNATAFTAPFSWTVYSSPTVTAPANQAGTIGSTVNLPALAFTCPNGPCTFAITGQPSGLSIDNNAVISGTIGGTPASFPNVRVTITDAAGASGRSNAFTWTTSYAPLLATTPLAQVSTVNTAITPVQLTASGGSGSYVWTGALPAGLTMTPAGRITGIPTVPASTAVTLTVTDTVTLNTMNINFNWTVLAKPTVTAPANQTTTIGATINLQLTTTCANNPCVYVLNNGPSTLSINSTGLITGTITSPAQPFGTVTVTVTDKANATATSAAFSWTVKAKPTVSPLANQTNTIGATISLQLTTTCANTPCSYVLNSGPATLSINSTGLITGTITSPAQIFNNVAVTVTDAASVSVTTSAFTWTVLAKPTITPTNQTTTLGATVSYTPPRTCPNTPCTFIMTGQPAGLSINASTGVITGIVTGVTQSNVVVTIKDVANFSVASTPFTWTVLAKPTITPANQTTSVGSTNTNYTPPSTCPNTPCTFTMTGAPTGLSINLNTGAITGTVGGSAQTYSTVVVTIKDAANFSVASSNFTWTVNPAPTLGNPGNQSNTIGAAISLQLTTTCANSPCSYTLNSGPATLSISSTGLITGTITSPAQTFSSVTVTVTDAANVSATTTAFTWTVLGTPTITPANQTTTLGATVSYTPTRTCPNSPCTFIMTGQPAGLTINAATGVITGTVTGTTQSNVIVTIKDAANFSAASSPFTWTVLAKPTITPANQTTSVGSTNTNYTPPFTCANSPCTFTMTGAPTGLGINSSTGAITGTVGGSAQTYSTVVVTIKDAANFSVASSNFTWTVNPALAVFNPGNQSFTGGTAINVDLSVLVSGGTAPYTYSIPGKPSWMTVNASTGAVTGTTPSAQSLTSVTVSVTDDTGVIVATPAVQLVVLYPSVAIANQVTKINTAVSINLDNYTTGGTAPYTYAIANKPSWLTYTAGTHVLSGTSPAGAGTTSNVTVTATDAAGAVVASAPFTWKVVASSTLTWSVIAAKSSLPNLAITNVNVTASVTNEVAGTFTAVGLPPGLVISAAGVISGTPTQPGRYRVTISANDSLGVSMPSAPFVWQVTDLAWSTIPAQSSTHAVADSLDVTPFDTRGVSAFTYAASNLPVGLTMNSTTGLISGTPTTVLATRAVTVTVTDAMGAVVTSTAFNWAVT